MDCDIMRVGPEPMPLVDPEPMPLVDKTAIARLCKVGVCGCEIPPENYDLCENHAVTEGMLRSCNIPVKWLRENRLENYLTSLAVLSSIVPLQEQERVTGKNETMKQQASLYRKRCREELTAANDLKAMKGA